MPDRRFRDMSLTEDDVQMLVNAHPTLWERLTDGKLDPESGAWETDTTALDRFTARAKRLLPLWREEAIRRNRLWFALVGLGLDIEGDILSDMTSREMRERIQRARALSPSDISARVNFILSELDK